MTSETFLSLRQFLNDKFPEIVVTIVTEFLFADMPMHVAFKRNAVGSTELLEFLVERGIRDTRSNRWTVAKLFHTNAHYFRWEFNKLLTASLRYGDVAAVHWVLDHFPDCRILPNVVTEAVERGDLALLQRFEAERDVHWTIDDLVSADHLNVIGVLDDRVGTRDTRKANMRAVKSAIERNRVDEVKWLITRGFGVAYDADLTAIRGDWEAQSQMVRFLLEKGFDKEHHYYTTGLKLAVEAGDLNFVKYIVINYTPKGIGKPGSSLYRFDCGLRTASALGHLPMVEWLIMNVETFGVQDAPAEAFRAAAIAGNLEMMQWLCERYSHNPSVNLFRRSLPTYQSDSLVCNTAAERGHLDIVSYLHQVFWDTQVLTKQSQLQRILRWTYKAVDAAAANGHLEVVKILHTQRLSKSGKFCSSKALDAAAAVGNLELLQWLQENSNARCSTEAMDTAAKAGWLDVIEWLHRNTDAGCTRNAMDEAAREGRLNVVQWLHTNRSEGCTIKALAGAASNGHLEVVQWLCKNRYRFEMSPKTSAMKTAAQNLHLEVVQWLCTTYPEETPVEALKEAASCQSNSEYALPIVQWLRSRCPGVDLTTLIDEALRSQRFEVALFLHSQHDRNTRNAADTVKVKEYLATQKQTECQHMLAWFEETYPV